MNEHGDPSSLMFTSRPTSRANACYLLKKNSTNLDSQGKTSSTVPHGNNFSTWQPWRVRLIDMWSPSPLIWAKFTNDCSFGLDLTVGPFIYYIWFLYFFLLICLVCNRYGAIMRSLNRKVILGRILTKY